jgi:hypothetical protein
MAESAKIVVDLKALEDLTRRYPEASAKARRSRLTEALLLLEAAVKRLTPEGAGPIHIRDTIFQEVNLRGEALAGILGTPAIYGEAVEYGTKPHFPPIKPILFWVEKKLGLSGKEAKSAAFCIARAISKRGTKGAEMFSKGFAMNESQIISILEQIPGDIVQAVSA